jgi:cyclophilin family peptidyl-prolyl cis-trans isomerase
LLTSQGPIEIEIDGTLAPWHAAVIRELSQRGYYNGLRFHRFVGNFVVQGGDPTGTGWGGPGFVVPSEVGSLLDGANQQFASGAVGFADAGKDTGGSQFFVMHARAPHLEGRYTVVGRVTAGLAAAMRLNVSDTVQKAEILQ